MATEPCSKLTLIWLATWAYRSDVHAKPDGPGGKRSSASVRRVNVIFAAVGHATGRFDELWAQVMRTSSVHEVGRGTSVRVAASEDGGKVVGHASDGTHNLVALGSGLRRLGETPQKAADSLLRQVADHRHGQPRDIGDVVVICADARAGDAQIVVGRGSQRLFLARPPEGGMLVSSCLATLAAALGPELAIDRSYEDFLLGYGFLPDGRTVFDGIVAAKAGTRYRLPCGDSQDLAPPPVLSDDPVPEDEGEAATFLYQRFMDVVEDQAGADRTHAVLLGGLDSALVAAALRRLGHRVETFTFDFADPRYNQRNTELVARALGTTHRSVVISADVIADAMAAFASTFNQPSAQPHYQIHTLHASGVIREHGFEHVFTGDGCDAVFLGYPTVNRRAELIARLGALPQPLTSLASAALKARWVERHLGHVARFARSPLDNLRLPMPARGHLPTRYLDEASLGRLRCGRTPQQAEAVDAIRIRLASPAAGLDPTRIAFHGNGLTGQSKAKVETAVAATGVSQSTPYSDPSIVSYVARLPAGYLRPAADPAGGSGKAILLRMIREQDLLPEPVIMQPKQSPSDSPIDEWYMGPLRPVVLELLRYLPFEWESAYVDELLAPKRAEAWFRERVSLSHHVLQTIGLLWSYASFGRLAAGVQNHR